MHISFYVLRCQLCVGLYWELFVIIYSFWTRNTIYFKNKKIATHNDVIRQNAGVV